MKTWPCAFALSAVAVSSTAVAASGPSSAYVALIEAYRRGDRADAIQRLSSWSRQQLQQEVEAITAVQRTRTAAENGDSPLRAAVMLHTDRFWSEKQMTTPDEARAGLQADVATALVSLLGDAPGGSSFARRWWLAMSLRFSSRMDWSDSLSWAEKGIRRFPDDAPLHLALGRVDELQGALGFDTGTGSLPRSDPRVRKALLRAAADARQSLLEAETAFERASRLDPTLAEARLRRGRVAWRLGRLEEAASELRWVREHSTDPELLYLAHLFEGRVQEDSGRLAEAVESYRAAIGVEPEAQTSRVALSHALRRSGDLEGSRRALQAALADAGHRRAPDAFWVYPVGHADRFNALFEELRRESAR